MKIRFFYFYLGLLLWLIILGGVLFGFNLKDSGVGITLAFLTLLLAPGFFVSRILKINQARMPVKILSVIGYSLMFYFLINLAALFFGLTLATVEIMTIILLLGLALIALVNDRQQIFELDLSGFFKEKTLVDWIIFTTTIAGGLLAFFAVSAQSDKLIGDGWFHLAILEKITSGMKLTPANIWITKDSSLNPVYSFPIWHILVGLLAKILDLNIFTALRQIVLPLSIVALFVWWSLIKIIFQNRYLAWIVFLSFILVFLHDGVFYYLVPLASPDSFNRLIFLPVILGLSLNYIVGAALKIPSAIFIGILAALMGVIHFTQYIYLVAALVVIAILNLLFRQSRTEIIKVGILLLGILAIVMPYLLIVHHGIISSFLAANAVAYRGEVGANNSPSSLDVLYRYAILALPMIFLFLKNEKKLILPVGLAITGIFISWHAFLIRTLFLKFFGPILADRGIGLVYNFIFIGVILYLLGGFLAKMLGRLRYGRILTISLTSLVIILSLVPSSRIDLGRIIEAVFFNNQLFLFSTLFWPLLVVLIVVALLIWRKYGNLSFVEPQNRLNFSIVSVGIIIFLAMPFWGNYQKTLAANQTGGIWANRESSTASDTDFIGGEKTIDFISSVDAGSVFIGDNPAFMQQLLLYAPIYAAEYPYSINEFIESKTFFDPTLILAERVALAQKLKVNYVILEHSDQVPMFNDFPMNFRQVYQNSTSSKTIYIFKFLE